VPVFNGNVVLYRAGRRGAEPVVLVHGLGKAAARDWAQVIPALASSFDVYALDLPGFGASDKGNHLYSPANYARVLDSLLAERIRRPFSLVGHSMGGVIALAFAADYPERVRRLVVADVAGVLHRSVYGEFLGRAVAGRAVGSESAWHEALIKLVISQAENLPAKGLMSIEQPQIRQRLLRGDPNAIAALALVEHDLGRGLRAIRAPTLVIWSKDDKVAPPRTGEVLASLIPGARLALLDEAGHAPHVSQPARFNALLREELAGRPQGRSYVQPAGEPASGRAGRCTSERGRRFTGDYEEIVLEGCTEVEIAEARVGRIKVSRSQARIVNSHVRDGIESHDARLEFTGGSLGGDPPLFLDETNVDAAGLRFAPRGRVVATNYGDETVTLRLSVSEVAGGKEPRYMHQILRLVADQSWTPRGLR
jgi:pimeloyl-ACP methyl ester carboxylesterase